MVNSRRDLLKGAAMFGKAQIAEAMQANFSGIEEDTYDVDEVTWVAEDDDIAACVFRFAWTGKVAGEAVAGGGHVGKAAPRVGSGVVRLQRRQ